MKLLAPYHLADGREPKRFYRPQPPNYRSHWDHADYRDKVTLLDYLNARLERAGVPYGSISAAHLMGSPVNAPRENMRQRVRLKPETLATRARKFLTLNAEYLERERHRKAMTEPEPPYLGRLARITPAKPTCQSRPEPFESGRNTLPGMERFV